MSESNSEEFSRSQTKSQTKSQTDVANMTFETALAELESIVNRLESGEIDLQASIDTYERGEALKKRCEELLKKAEARIEKITLDADGAPTGTAPLDMPENG